MPFIGTGHIWLIGVLLIIVLIVWGPGKLPEVGSGMGRAIREFRKASAETKAEFSKVTSARAPGDTAATAPGAPVAAVPDTPVAFAAAPAVATAEPAMAAAAAAAATPISQLAVEADDPAFD